MAICIPEIIPACSDINLNINRYIILALIVQLTNSTALYHMEGDGRLRDPSLNFESNIENFQYCFCSWIVVTTENEPQPPPSLPELKSIYCIVLY